MTARMKMKTMRMMQMVTKWTIKPSHWVSTAVYLPVLVIVCNYICQVREMKQLSLI
jgi:uncharacterized protein (DUF983 family)